MQICIEYILAFYCIFTNTEWSTTCSSSAVSISSPVISSILWLIFSISGSWSPVNQALGEKQKNVSHAMWINVHKMAPKVWIGEWNGKRAESHALVMPMKNDNYELAPTQRMTFIHKRRTNWRPWPRIQNLLLAEGTQKVTEGTHPSPNVCNRGGLWGKVPEGLTEDYSVAPYSIYC